MAKANETMRVGTPIRARKLLALLAAAEPSDEATVRHFHGQLIIEEPERTLLDIADAAIVDDDPERAHD